MDTQRTLRRAIGCMLTFAAMLTLSDGVRAWTNFNIYLWPNGRVPYRFATAADVDRFGQPAVPLTAATENLVRAEMAVWEEALTAADPAGGAARRYIRFVDCADDCENEDNYILIRMNNAALESNNMCSWRSHGRDWPGRHLEAGGVTELHFSPGQDGNTIRHELGHCLGLWHEFNRPDRDSWLREQPDADGADEWTEIFGVSNPGGSGMPELGNYDYDSIMHYGSTTNVGGVCVTRWTDRQLNRFNRHGLDAEPEDKPCWIFPADAGTGIDGDQVSARDTSRILQYYARDAQPNWGFFESLNTPPGPLAHDSLPNPYLPGHIRPVGTPTIAYQSSGNFDVFVRGADNFLYWKSFRRHWLPFEPQPVDEVSAWTSLGWQISSDPSAVSRAPDRIDVAAVNSRGELQRLKYVEGVWEAPLTIRGGSPVGGLKLETDGGYVGPAIASRASDLLDVFVVRADGRLAVTTWADGNWGAWRNLGQGYNVTARPAGVAVSATAVRLALNESNVNLYEPFVTFAPDPLGFLLGPATAVTARRAAPAIASRASVGQPYRVLIQTAENRIAHKFAGGGWRDIGGIPTPDSGVSAATTGPFSALIVMNGEEATACVRTCLAAQPNPGTAIQPGGVWLREFR
jgi:hypothetical protein